MRMIKDKKGFTITELLAVIAVLGIVLVIAIPTYIGINNTVKKKMLEEKIEVIEEAAVLFGESIKETVLTSGNMYKEESPCQSVSISYLVPRYLEKDNEEECLNGNEEEIGCVVDPSDATNYLDNEEVIIYYKNKRIYAVVDVNDELVCEGEENSELKINTFYIGNGNPEYTINKEVTAYISWDSLDVEYYCVTNTQGSSNCEWKIASGTMVTPSHTLTDGDGEKTIYAYIRDSKGNISEEFSDTILLDTSAPTDNSVSINLGNNETNNANVTLTLSSIGASEMCISNTSSCSDWETYATSKSWTISSGDGPKIVYVWFRDANKNESDYVTDSITLDTTAPTVEASESSKKIVFTSTESGTYCINTSSSRTNMSNCVSSGNISANTSVTTNALSSGTYYVHVKDSAGNIGISSSISITISSPFGEYLINNPTTGLNTSTSYAGMYRYRGTTVNNYVKLGSILYRIIGITSSANSTIGLEKNQVKLIKASSIGNYAWSYDGSLGKDSWINSKIHAYLQSSSVLGNTSIIPSGWSAKIDSVKWYIGYAFDEEQYSHDTTINTILSNVRRSVSSSTSKIGLMYSHDWCLANNLSMSSYCDADYYTWNWMIPSNCKSSSICYIYTMTKTEYSPDWNDGADWIDTINSDDDGAYLTGLSSGEGANMIFPAFYLLPSVNYVSGTGTSSDPFIIS